MLFVWAFLLVYIIVGSAPYEPTGSTLRAWKVLPAAMCPVNGMRQHVLIVNADISEECMAPEIKIIKFGLGNDA